MDGVAIMGMVTAQIVQTGGQCLGICYSLQSAVTEVCIVVVQTANYTVDSYEH